MSDELKKLFEMAKKIEMTPSEIENQRRSFAYGNTHFENENITMETIIQADELLKNKNGSKD